MTDQKSRELASNIYTGSVANGDNDDDGDWVPLCSTELMLPLIEQFRDAVRSEALESGIEQPICVTDESTKEKRASSDDFARGFDAGLYYQRLAFRSAFRTPTPAKPDRNGKSRNRTRHNSSKF